MTVASLSNVDITVTRPTYATDFAGAETLSIVFEGRARIQPLSGKEQLKYASEKSIVTALGYVAGAPNIKRDDILAVGTQTYLVRAVRDIDHVGSFVTIELEEQV